eukprot:TRINITY_DN8168_c0_g1_i1.p1 TRINITY_DN8168_c0_g1~~TRINITY_DN8168_c0_g1_i1.p1  ORF type:complete len:373 (+),score=95.11 TRINITY_DN8168_c0_g1_i1:3-1121(+)
MSSLLHAPIIQRYNICNTTKFITKPFRKLGQKTRTRQSSNRFQRDNQKTETTFVQFYNRKSSHSNPFFERYHKSNPNPLFSFSSLDESCNSPKEIESKFFAGKEDSKVNFFGNSSSNDGKKNKPINIKTWRPIDTPLSVSEKGFMIIQNEIIERGFPAMMMRNLKNADKTVFPFLEDVDFNALDERVKQKVEELMSNEKNLKLAVDNSAKVHIRVASLVLAIYRSLEEMAGANRENLMELLQICVCENIQEWVKTALTIPLVVSSNPIPTLKSALERETRMRGNGFDIIFQLESTYNGFLNVTVNRCLYHNFFVENGANHLTRIFCIAEKKMLDGMGTTNKVPRRLARGDKDCLFKIDYMEPDDETDIQLSF